MILSSEVFLTNEKGAWGLPYSDIDCIIIIIITVFYNILICLSFTLF